MRYSKYTIFLKVVELESFSKTADFYKYWQKKECGKKPEKSQEWTGD